MPPDCFRLPVCRFPRPGQHPEQRLHRRRSCRICRHYYLKSAAAGASIDCCILPGHRSRAAIGRCILSRHRAGAAAGRCILPRHRAWAAIGRRIRAGVGLPRCARIRAVVTHPCDEHRAPAVFTFHDLLPGQDLQRSAAVRAQSFFNLHSISSIFLDILQIPFLQISSESACGS